jgi:hypothetical protein
MLEKEREWAAARAPNIMTSFDNLYLTGVFAGRRCGSNALPGQPPFTAFGEARFPELPPLGTAWGLGGEFFAGRRCGIPRLFCGAAGARWRQCAGVIAYYQVFSPIITSATKKSACRLWTNGFVGFSCGFDVPAKGQDREVQGYGGETDGNRKAITSVLQGYASLGKATQG